MKIPCRAKQMTGRLAMQTEVSRAKKPPKPPQGKNAPLSISFEALSSVCTGTKEEWEVVWKRMKFWGRRKRLRTWIAREGGGCKA